MGKHIFLQQEPSKRVRSWGETLASKNSCDIERLPLVYPAERPPHDATTRRRQGGRGEAPPTPERHPSERQMTTSRFLCSTRDHPSSNLHENTLGEKTECHETFWARHASRATSVNDLWKLLTVSCVTNPVGSLLYTPTRPKTEFFM